MDRISQIIQETIDKFVTEASNNSTLATDDNQANDSEHVKYIKRYRRQAGNKVSKSDVDDVADIIDNNYVNVSALAQDVFPNCKTPQGAQSMLRKKLNGDRPLRKKELNKITSDLDF